jgi:hypothetical protein
VERMPVPDLGTDPTRVSAYAPMKGRGRTVRVLLPLLDASEQSEPVPRSWRSIAEPEGISLTSDTRLHDLTSTHSGTLIPASGVVDQPGARSLLAAVGVGSKNEELAVFAFWRGYSEDRVEPDESIKLDADRLGPWPPDDFLFVVRPLEFIVASAEPRGVHFPSYIWPLDLTFTFALPAYGDSYFLTSQATTEDLRSHGLEAFSIEVDREVPTEGD